MKLVKLPVAKIKPAAYNPRKDLKPGDPEYESLKRSIQEFGAVEPLVWNKRTGNLVGGHQRFKILTREARVTHVEAIEVDLDPRQERALNVALNKISGDWDLPKLKGLLGDLDSAGFDITLTGFSHQEFEALLGPEEEAGPGNADAVPGIPAKPITKPGDIWELGDHRVMCGDSTSAKDFESLMGGGRASMVFTDPPYGVSYRATSGKHDRIRNDEKRDDELVGKLLLPCFRLLAQHTMDQAAFYIWHASSTREDFAFAMKAAGLIERQYLIWNKGQVVLGWDDYLWAHEPCFYAGKDGQKPAFYGDRGNATVWQVSMAKAAAVTTSIGTGILVSDGQGNRLFIAPNPPKAKKLRKIRLEAGQALILGQDSPAQSIWTVSRETQPEHPTQKPVELAVRAIGNSTQPGDIVLDAFAGSGSTLIGAEKTGRRCFTMELEPKYCDVVVKRWEQFTGKTAKRTKNAKAAA